jgi:hypothetical protein
MLFSRRDPGLVSDTDETILESACTLTRRQCSEHTRISKGSQEVQTVL